MANLANHLVTVKDANNNVVASGTTNSNGDISFYIPQGTYKVDVTPPDGYEFSSASIEDSNSSNNGISQLPLTGIDIGNTSANVVVNFSQVVAI